MESEGKQVHLDGRISYFNFATHDNKNRQAANIRARNFYLCDSMSDEEDGLFGMAGTTRTGVLLNSS